MASKDEDPMDFLNKMRGKLSAIQSITEDQQKEVDLIANARKRMDKIDELLADVPVTKQKPTLPPPGLTPDEEVTWWNNKIASLSGNVSDSSESKLNKSKFDKNSKSYDSKTDWLTE